MFAMLEALQGKFDYAYGNQEEFDREVEAELGGYKAPKLRIELAYSLEDMFWAGMADIFLEEIKENVGR
jgi:hypothetical protein